MLRDFKISPYIGYTNKQVHNEPTEAYLFIIRIVFKQIKIKKHVQLRTKRVKLDVNKKIGNFNETIKSGITSMNGKEFKTINVMSVCNK